MPAILTEIGFLSNSKDRAAMITKDGQTAIARRLFNAFCQYKEIYESGTETENPAKMETFPANNSSNSGTRETDKNRPSANAQEYYSIQILSVGKILKKDAPDLKGRKDTQYIKSSGAYKYMIGKYSSRAEAAKSLPEIKKKFPGSFIIHIKDGKIIK